MRIRNAKAAGVVVLLSALTIFSACTKLDPDEILYRKTHRPIHDTLKWEKVEFLNDTGRKTIKAEPIADTIMKDTLRIPLKPRAIVAAPGSE